MDINLIGRKKMEARQKNKYLIAEEIKMSNIRKEETMQEIVASGQ